VAHRVEADERVDDRLELLSPAGDQQRHRVVEGGPAERGEREQDDQAGSGHQLPDDRQSCALLLLPLRIFHGLRHLPARRHRLNLPLKLGLLFGAPAVGERLQVVARHGARGGGRLLRERDWLAAAAAEPAEEEREDEQDDGADGDERDADAEQERDDHVVPERERAEVRHEVAFAVAVADAAYDERRPARFSRP
jgi:hypothetical protein